MKEEKSEKLIIFGVLVVLFFFLFVYASKIIVFQALQDKITMLIIAAGIYIVFMLYIIFSLKENGRKR